MTIRLPIVSKFEDKGVKDAESAMGKLGKTVAGIGIAAAAAAGAAGVALLTKSLTSGFERLTAIDNAQAKLRGLGHDAQSVETIMTSALDSVKGTAFGLGEAATIAASAVAAGIQPGQELTRYLTLAADAASIAGMSMDEMGSIMNKVTTSGKAQNDVLSQIADRGLPIYQLLAEQLGVTAGEVFTLASKGQVSAEVFQAAMEQGFGGAALKAGETVEGSMANMEAALARLGAALLGTTFEELPQVFGEITDALDGLLPEFKAIGEQVGPVLIETFKQLADAIIPLLGPLMSIVSALLPPLARLVAAIAPLVVRLIEAFIPLIEKILPPLELLFEALIDILTPLVDSLLIPLIDVVMMLADAFAPLVAELLPVFVEIFELIAPVVKDLIEAFMPFIMAVLTPVISLVSALAPIILQLVEAFMPLLNLLAPLLEVFLELLSEALKPLLDEVVPFLIPIIQDLADKFEWLADNVLTPLLTTLKNIIQALKDIFKFHNQEVNFKVTGTVTQAITSTQLQAGRIGMAKGGQVASAGMSWVGEKGPELLSFPKGATVTPIPQHMRAEAMMGSKGTQAQAGNYITINVNGGLDSSAAIGEAVVTAIRKYERTSGPVFVRA